jgi:hypothetical protein
MTPEQAQKLLETLAKIVVELRNIGDKLDPDYGK